jgi:hypothetical protein
MLRRNAANRPKDSTKSSPDPRTSSATLTNLSSIFYSTVGLLHGCLRRQGDLILGGVPHWEASSARCCACTRSANECLGGRDHPVVSAVLERVDFDQRQKQMLLNHRMHTSKRADRHAQARSTISIWTEDLAGRVDAIFLPAQPDHRLDHNQKP